MRRAVVGAVALCLMSGATARAQDGGDLAGLLAVMQEHFGQSMGEAVLGGQSVFVTARGVAKLPAPAARPYDLQVEAQGPTAVQAARLRDDKVDRLRAVAKRFSLQLTVGEPSYVTLPRAVSPPRPAIAATPGATLSPPIQAPGATPAPQVTARIPVHFARPPEAQMPAFIDALREAGIETLPDTNGLPNPLAQVTQMLGLGGTAVSSATVDPATWDKASAAAVQAAKSEAEALASPADRHVGALRQVMLLSRSIQGDEAVVTVAARFGFAPEK
jgi:hypothetical protein